MQPHARLRPSRLAYIPPVAPAGKHDVFESAAKRIIVNLGKHQDMTEVMPL
jgi:hypothetical protein